MNAIAPGSHVEPPTPDTRPLKIFVRGLNWVGDAIMATPALSWLRTQFPKASITLMVRPWVSAIYEHNPDIDWLWVHDDSASMGEFLKAARMIRRERFDIGIALPNSLRSAALLRLGVFIRRYGYRRGILRGMMLNRPVPLNPAILQVHQVYYYLDILRPLCGVPRVPPPQRAVAGDVEREEVARLLRGLGLDRDQPLFGIAPGSINSEAKRWLPERFAECADRLTREWGAAVLLLGSTREGEVLEEVQKRCRTQVYNLCGEVNLGQLIALMERLNGLVTNDAGGMHVAAALGVPTVAIFGPTEWTCTYPFSKRAKIVRKEGVPCAPCMLRECPIEGHPCMSGVTTDMVLDTLDALTREPA